MTYPPPQDPYQQPDDQHPAYDTPYIPGPPQPPVPGAPYSQPPAGWHATQPLPQPPPGYPQSPGGPQPWPGQVSTGGPYRQMPTVPPTMPVPPPRKGMSTGKLLLIIGAVVVGLCCVGGAILAAVAPQTTNTASSTVTRDVAPPTKAAASTAPATPAAATKPAPPPAPTTKAAAVDPKAQTAAAIGRWYQGGGKARMDAITADFNTLTAAAGNTDVVAVGQGCRTMQADVEAAQAYAPIPDAESQRYWSAALASYARAATDCVAAVDTVNADLMTKAGTELDDGNANVLKASARVLQLAGG